ncbi:hypothetical protein PMIN01_06885 [Paraphaeosphaeria minitans]|uniref:DUF1989 domain-containing protein n=1 Tax=Paraphaeosphaeria minitans TaxID=565426 RepID=A0A9P6GI82_9PLEO|nr:hypothetical protein PMIN01_06885 [Paraphaeosphaeria minitans]
MAKAKDEKQKWPVHLDHCFARIILDNAVGKDKPWTKVVKSPAIKHMSEQQLKDAIKLGESIADGSEDINPLNQRSLEVRGKSDPGKKRKANAHTDAADKKTKRSEMGNISTYFLPPPAMPKNNVPAEEALAFQLPNRRAVASLALVTVLSAIEKQRKAKADREQESDFAAQDMSGELQTIPARHGVATFVPRGRTIKIINTYGQQVVSTWAFGLAAPPEEGEHEEEEELEGKVDDFKKKLSKEEGKGEETNDKAVERDEEDDAAAEEDATKVSEGPEATKEEGHPEEEQSDNPATKDGEVADDPSEQAPDTPENEKSDEKKPEKRTWSSYLPSIPYRNRGQDQGQNRTDAQAQQEEKTEKAQNEETSKKWSSYLPTGKGFSSYVPNVKMPDTQGVVSAFKSSNSWDPNKSYAEQLYDFSKTPVGAGTLAVASGSGTASSLYAAYNAYTQINPSKNDQPPMEYLSLPHTRAATYRLVPELNDTLLTNLRNPLITLVEDTSAGAHDTLTAACDANMYAALGVDKPEEHGSCAENLVLALRELNEKAGLKGTKAIGADITVNIAPTPLHLFMNTPIQLDSSAKSEGAGAKGAKLSVEKPVSKKRSYVRFRAERDVVVVLSACPNELGKQNGGRCMAANFMVEEPEEDPSTSTSPVKSKKAAPKKLGSKKDEKKEGKQDQEEKLKGMPGLKGGPKKPAAVKKSAERAPDDNDDPPESELPEEAPKKEEVKRKPLPKLQKKSEEVVPKAAEAEPKGTPKVDEAKPEEPPKPKKKPKKLERRTATPKSEAS